MNKKPALGRGLSALLENEKSDITTKETSEVSTTVGSIAELEISQIVANPFQPRTKFEEQALIELAQSIKTLGIIQPITVRKLGYNQFQLISGERRFRASQLAGLHKIPAYIRIANDQSMLEMALVENIQRSNLDAIEIAISYQRLIDECSLTQEVLSQRVGKQRSTISNYLRLLKLPAEIQAAIRENKISMGHARALINIESETEQINVLHQILEETLSVRKTEELAKEKKESSQKPHNSAVLPLSLVDKKLKSDLSKYFEVKVNLQRKDIDRGRLVIPFNSDEELSRIIKLMNL
ncbi:MAG: ParB/RepB/Spo0J family partition protein [Bacteroidetes bacterium]|nr:MAG: ParB/RepB/Spo0J family partition protein [Bacteroidota bacterium]MBL1144659.1 ParB/RepB/Spo0J family partition protein [Bacteroidota bacterium]NOG57454.1 ParB/RepB/Spo0J family partition protein [Bacteroidota bacterium]